MPSKTSIAGAIGFGHQSAKDSVASSVLYMPATSVNVNMNQNSQTLPAEIGGDYFLRGSYKASVSGGGDVAFVARPTSLGHLFLMLCGQGSDAVTNPSTGVYTHTFTPFLVGSGQELPWYTAYKDVSTLLAEQYLNTKLRSLRLDIPKSSIMTGQASLVATTPSSITSASLGTKTFDSSPQFQTCQATVSLTQEGSGTNISSNSVRIERASLNYESNITSDEYSVGSYFLDDVTLLQRTVTVDLDFIVRDAALYQAVYLNGASIPSSWSPTIYRGSLGLTLSSTSNIPTTSTPYSCTFTFPGLDFLMMPLPMQGSELVRGTLSTQVTLGPSGSDRFSITLTNGTASY